jgi:hypothetical protein
MDLTHSASSYSCRRNETAAPQSALPGENQTMETTDTSLFEIYEELGVRDLMESAAALRFIDEVLMEKEQNIVANIKTISPVVKRSAA